MPVTINDIAKIANVSPSTVSRVIAGNPRISSATRERIRKILDEKNYHPNFVARSLAGKSLKIVGVILPETTEKTFQHPFFPEILRGIGTLANQNKYNILLASTKNNQDEKNTVREFVRGGITEGVILLTSRTRDSSISELKKAGFPFVVVGRPEDEQKINWVDNNNFSAGYELTRHFIQKGHKRIAFLGHTKEFIVILDRFNGYRKALEDHGLHYEKQWVVEEKFFDSITNSSVLEKIFIGDPRPTGIIACDDFQAFEAMNTLNRLGLKVPEDVSVAGFNNVLLSNYSTPSLTSVEVNAFNLGYKAFELLLSSIGGSCESFGRVILPTEIIVRNSIADINSMNL